MRHRITALAASASIAFAALALVAGPAAADPVCGPGPHYEPNIILGTLGDDRLVGDQCANILVGLAGDDVLIGRLGEDVLRGGRHNDRLRAIDGEADQVNGGSGFDRCRGDQFDSFRRCEVLVVVTVPV